MTNKGERGLLVVLSGPSGCGKGTVLAELFRRHSDTVLSVSVTTRSPRPGEEDGVQYFFRTREEFERMIRDDELLEYAEYNGNYYGTPRFAVEENRNAGRNVILEIEVQGAMQVMERESDHVSVFLGVPSMEELERRLRGRGTESEEVIRRRLDTARREVGFANRYRYFVLNDTVEQAVARLEHILEAEKLRYDRVKTTMEGF